MIHFFEKHRWLLRDPRFEKEATLRLRIARRTSRAATRPRPTVPAPSSRGAKAQDERRRLLAVARALAAEGDLPRLRLVLRQALRVARCESGYSVSAQNGQYLGLFQMGIERAADFRSRRDRARAGAGGVPLLRPLGPRLEPVVVQALVLSRPPRIRAQSAEPGLRAGFPPSAIAGRERPCRSGGSPTA